MRSGSAVLAVETQGGGDCVRKKGTGFGGDAWPRGDKEVVETVSSEGRSAALHLRFVGCEEPGEETAVLAEHVAGEIHGLAVDAELRVVGTELLTSYVGLHVELVHVPGAGRVAGLAHSHPVDRLVWAVPSDAECDRAFDLQHGGPEATVGRVIERARVAPETLVPAPRVPVAPLVRRRA